MSGPLSSHRRSLVEAKLESAEQVLAISNQIVQLTTEIFIRGGNNVQSLIKQQADSSAKIRALVQDITEHLETKKEKELFAAASARWSSVHRYEQSLHVLTNANRLLQNGTTAADVVFPLLVDIVSWRAFIEYLRADLDGAGNDWEARTEVAARTSDLLRANQELKSKIAERKRIEERLSQLTSIVESSSDAIVIFTLGGTIVSWNKGAERVYGHASGEVLGKSGSMLLASERYDELTTALEKLENGETVRMSETVHLRKGGVRIDVSTAISPVKNAEGETVGAAAITRDISDRKRAEERFYKAFQANPEPITIARLADGVYIDVNDSFLRVTGCVRQEVVGHAAKELKFWERAEDRAKLLETIEKSGSVRDLEITFVTKSGQQRVGMISGEIIELGGEKCVISIFRDMTEQKMLELQLRKAQRMEAIGQLSGGIAHDFNNLLTVMIGHSELLESRLAHTDASSKSVSEIKKAGNHAASLTRQLLAFSRQQVLERKVLDLNTIVNDLEKMLRRLIGEDIEMHTKLDPRLAHIKVDPGQIQQVIMNLVVNARDAMPNGGTLTIRTANVQVGSDRTVVAPGSYVVLEISDTGEGMDAETQAKVFEPFFTTKEVGKGTGLGLSTVYGVIKQSAGYITIDSACGRGAKFTIYLPQTAEKTLSQVAGPHKAQSLRGTETILLVEDATPVRELAREWLIASGYTVLEAACPSEALEIVESNKQAIHLLITDVIMPGMNGATLARKVKQKRPEAKILYISGYTGFIDQHSLAPEAIIVAKPFTREVLLGKIREVVSPERELEIASL
jgi:two-component system cell cycle sensor histidine kinase/response regulator CckA